MWLISAIIGFIVFIPISALALDEGHLLNSIDKLEAGLNEREAVLLYVETALTDKTQGKDGAASYEEIVACKDNILGDTGLTAQKKAEFLARLAEALINLGRREEAFKICEDFSRQSPETGKEASGLFCLVGNHFRELGEYPLATQSYERAKTLALEEPKSAYVPSHILIDLGFCYYKEGKYEKALDEYNQSIGKDSALDSSSLQWTLLQIGRCHFFLGDYEQAKDFFLHAVNVNPSSDLAQQAKVNIEDIDKMNLKP